jgi:hypothetical protein
MKNRLTPLCAALFAISGGMAHAGADEIRSESRQIVIDADVVVAAEGSGRTRKEVVISQGGPEGMPRRVEVFGDGDMAGLGDLDAVISNAFAESFSPNVMMRTGKSVKNAPYSAEVITEKIQTLPDGNQISKRSSSQTWRDSAGRTRQEVRDAKGEIKTVHINDAVDGARYVLSPGKKTAMKIGMPADMQKHIEELKERAKSMAKDGKSTVIERSGPGQEIIIKRIEGPAGEGKKDVREEVKVNVVRNGNNVVVNGVNVNDIVVNAMSDAARTGPLSLPFQDMKWSSKSTTTSLGTKDIDGVKAEGKSVAYTIPAGEVGNKNPITVTTESWYSPELQVTVYSKHSDPRSGDNIYRLANIKRAEPASTLFAVPSDYTVKDSPSFSFRTKSGEEGKSGK